MSDNELQELLADDFARACRRLENDRFAERLLMKLSARRGRRLAIVSAAGAAGAGFAVAQFAKMVDVLAAAKPFLDNASGVMAPFAVSSVAPYQFLAAATLAIAFMATMFILQSEI